uniref:Putative g-protein coupled receptor 158 isoform x3 n=1 Tax=Lutzomyia longipalpis TaxID=7200 RepID=A0A1B0C9Q1_LUTLO
MIVAVLCYLSAFTASAMDFLEHGGLLGLEEDDTNTCRPLKWDYVTQAGEMFILAFGLHLGYASRNANTQFRERQFLVASILIEFVVSSLFYILRALYLPELSPGAIFLALFLRSQLTNTVTVGLIFLPKLWYQHKQNSLQVRSLTQELSCRLPVDAFKGSHDVSHHGGGSAVGGGGACILGDPDIGDLSLSEMNPEDIRAELKRLYTQLEILKNKTLRQDNPHISKRRGGRKVAHRRFSLQPWCRELGFVICYGAIILKLYRHLIEFRTRKAHRWVVRDLDLLKYLCAMIVAVLCYLSAFTASAMDFLEHGGLLGLEEDDTNTCRPLKWDYVTQAGEMFILAFGLHLGYASRNANTQFRERQFLVASILIEFVVSSLFYILRALYLPELSPGAIFLALFLRSQLTNTVTVGLIFLPKLWYQHKQNSLQVRSLTQELSCRLPVDAFKGSHDVSHHGGGSAVGGGGACILGDPDIGDLSLSEMNPEDIRAELKRLYTQLEILKNKTLRQDNPHISKRRGGRKVAHRRFSLQALSAKHRSNRHNAHDMEVTEAEPSRTPEDSVCSAEGPTDTGGELSAVSASK